jgi:hypothetical protein
MRIERFQSRVQVQELVSSDQIHAVQTHGTFCVPFIEPGSSLKKKPISDTLFAFESPETGSAFLLGNADLLIFAPRSGNPQGEEFIILSLWSILLRSSF